MAYSKDIPRTWLKDELRMVLVGKTGVGKSETGNTIIGEDIFVADDSAESVTKTSRQHTFQRNGQNLQLIDVPGFVDSSLTPEEIKGEVMKCVTMSHPGLHAILFVVEVGRFKEEDAKTLEQFCACFGEDSMRYVIAIFTKVDSLKRKKKTLDNFIQDSPSKLKEFLSTIDHRYMGVNNWSENEEEKHNFFENLLDNVKKLIVANSGTYYTNEMYEKAEEKLRAKLQEEIDRLAREEKERDQRILRDEREKYQKLIENEKLDKAEVAKKLEEIEREIAEERRDRAIKNQRKKIGALVGGIAGGVVGAALVYAGSEATEMIGAAVGGAIGGPVGVVIGHIAGGVIGQMVATRAAQYVEDKVGKDEGEMDGKDKKD